MKIGRYILLLAILVIIVFFNKINIKGQVLINKWDGFSKFYNQLGWRDKTTFKLFNKLDGEDSNIYPGVYNFTWSYRYKDFRKIITTPPPKNLLKITALEGRSIYDIDNLLARKWVINKGDYVSYTQDKANIFTLSSKYPFLTKDITTLEWYLYPDTYMIDINKEDVVWQLVDLQLKNFNNKIWTDYSALFNQINLNLKRDWFGFELSPYSVIKLASIIENEEKNDENKPTIWGIFLNRINNSMQIDADITLCYGEKITYSECTPNFIVQHLTDKNNPYNTRARAWLPPTPISSPTFSSIMGVLKYNKTDYLFYLHSPNWKIYYGKTLEEHNRNKQNYLK